MEYLIILARVFLRLVNQPFFPFQSEQGYNTSCICDALACTVVIHASSGQAFLFLYYLFPCSCLLDVLYVIDLPASHAAVEFVNFFLLCSIACCQLLCS
jgi:hypothetical protein